MGNTECQRCLSAEREMFAEILLGKNKNNNHNYYNHDVINIKRIYDDIPKDIIINKSENNNINYNFAQDKIYQKKNQNANQNKINEQIKYNINQNENIEIIQNNQNIKDTKE